MMNRKRNISFFGISCFSVIALILLFGMFGCASTNSIPVEKQVLMSYQGMGEVLNTSKPILKSLCDNGTINAEDCETARVAYNEAVKAYHALAPLAESVIDTGTDSEYRAAALALMEMLSVIQTYTGSS